MQYANKQPMFWIIPKIFGIIYLLFRVRVYVYNKNYKRLLGKYCPMVMMQVHFFSGYKCVICVVLLYCTTPFSLSFS